MSRNRNRNKNKNGNAEAAKTITPDELSEYTVRAGRMRAAQLDLLLIDESFRAFLRGIGNKYDVGTRFEINTQTGEIKVANKQPDERPQEQDLIQMPESDDIPDNVVRLGEKNG